jgi:hypothetical protein
LELPALPAAEFALRLRSQADSVSADLAALLTDELPRSATDG